jgi:TatD DNase family protein
VDLFDSHVHLDDAAFASDLDLVIERARQAGVLEMVTAGTDIASSRAAVTLAERFPGVRAAVGIHPHDAGRATAEAMAELRALAVHPKVAAIGETGLDYAKDYAKDYAPREVQRQALIEHIRISVDLSLPLIIHYREAYWEVLEIVEREQANRVIMHAFSGSTAIGRPCMERGYFVSVAGPVTFRNSRDTAEVAQEVPLELLLVETDAPVLTPEPFRGRRNEPAYLPYIVRRLAALRGQPAADIAAATTANARRVYGIG